MDNNDLIKLAKGMIIDFHADDTIIDHLKGEGLNDEEAQRILNISKTEHFEQEYKTIARSNKFRFYLWTSLTIATFLFFILVVPLWDTVGYTFILSVTGAALCCLFGYHILFYNKTWEDSYVQKHGKPWVNYSFLVITLIPGVILYFIFSARFSSAQDDILKNTQQEAVGHVITGSATDIKRVGGGGVEYAVVVVEFETKEGKKVIARKEVPSYKFKDFYLGQEINLIYSKTNPENIDLLIDDDNVRRFKNSQEREFEVPDLIPLPSVDQNLMTDELNKISFGWVYNAGKHVWINERRKSAVALFPNELRLIGNHDYNYLYPNYLESNGFTKISKEESDDILHTGKKIYQNDKFIITVQATENNSLISVTRK